MAQTDSRGSILLLAGTIFIALLTSAHAFAGLRGGTDELHCTAQSTRLLDQPIAGTIHLKILLVEFQDVHCRKDRSRVLPRYLSKDYENLLGSDGAYVSPVMYSPDGDPVYGSMNDYFRVMSGGTVRIQATVINPIDNSTGLPLWVTLSHEKMYYEQDKSKDSIFVEAERAASAVGLDVTTSADTKLAIIYAGNTYYNAGGLNPVAWENRYIMSEVQGRPYNQENPDARFSRIGIHCHEFAHTIGIGHSSGSGADLMCSGTKNGSVEGNAPAPLNPIARMKAGWVNVLAADNLMGESIDLGYSLQVPTIYRMRNTNGDYFLIENRRFDQTMAIGTTVVPDYNNVAFFPPARPHGTITQGIFVWRVNATGDVRDPGYSTEGLIYASGRFGRTYPENTPSETDDGVPFPGVSNARILSPWSDSRNPYTKEADFFGSSTPHYTLFVPNTKGGSSRGMEILSEDRVNGSFRVKFTAAYGPDKALELAKIPDSLGIYPSQRTVLCDSDGTTHQVLETGGEVFYRKSLPGTNEWQGTCQLSNGNGGNGAPCVAKTGAGILVAWQVQATGVGNYVIHSRRSMDAGNSWTELVSLASANGCADFGPRPCLAGDADGRTILVYCTSNSVFSAMSGNSGKAWGSPSRAFTFSRVCDGPSVIATISSSGFTQVHLVVCADSVSSGHEVWYAVYDFRTGNWAEAQNVADILPSQYKGFTHACFIVGTPEDGGDTWLAWDATDSSNSHQKLIICRELASSGPGSLFSVQEGKSLDDLRMDELQELSTGIDLEGSPSTVARGFVLEQNYPNPFNPRTVVRSQLPVASNVKLVVYDVLGREVVVLVNERRAVGSYQDSFDASGLASGVYVYRLTARQTDGGQAGAFVQSRRMLLLK